MAQFTNQAQLSYNNIVVNSNVVTGEILEVVSANKTAVVDTYSADSTVTYVVSIVKQPFCIKRRVRKRLYRLFCK